MVVYEDKSVEAYLEALLSEGELTDDVRELMMDPNFDDDWDVDHGESLAL